MAFPDLIRTPAYQQALRTPSVMGRAPATAWAVREPHLLASYQIREAGFRLDHLVRRALDPNSYPDWPPLWICSAIKTFLEVIEAKISSVRFPNVTEVHEFIDPRLELARAIIARTDRALVEDGRAPISSDGFRQEVVVHGTQIGISIDDIIFENPLSSIQAAVSAFSTTREQSDLLSLMRLYWN